MRTTFNLPIIYLFITIYHARKYSPKSADFDLEGGISIWNDIPRYFLEMSSNWESDKYEHTQLDPVPSKNHIVFRSTLLLMFLLECYSTCNQHSQPIPLLVLMEISGLTVSAIICFGCGRAYVTGQAYGNEMWMWIFGMLVTLSLTSISMLVLEAPQPAKGVDENNI